MHTAEATTTDQPETLTEHFASVGLGYVEHDGDQITIWHKSDKMQVVATCAAMMGGAAAVRFEWLEAGNRGPDGAWATLRGQS